MLCYVLLSCMHVNDKHAYQDLSTAHCWTYFAKLLMMLYKWLLKTWLWRSCWRCYSWMNCCRVCLVSFTIYSFVSPLTLTYTRPVRHTARSLILTRIFLPTRIGYKQLLTSSSRTTHCHGSKVIECYQLTTSAWLVTTDLTHSWFENESLACVNKAVAVACAP
jgi:hypothetical protein